MTDIEDRAERWGTIVCLLSLDYVQPFVEDMGLVVPDASRLRELTRQAVNSNRDDFVSGSAHRSLANRFLIEVGQGLGIAVADHIESWADRTFTIETRDQLPWRSWFVVFEVASRDSDRWQRLGFMSEGSSLVREIYVQTMQFRELFQKRDELHRTALTDWDLHMFAIHELDFDEHDPFNWIFLTVETYRMQLFFKRLRSQLTDSELSRIWPLAQDAFTDVLSEVSMTLVNPLQLLESM
jgi:hypothetical protein